MKHLLITILALLLTACNSKEKKEIIKTEPLTIAEKIANAHGFEHWKNISKIKFTFNVDKDSSHYERHWLWIPKTNDVVMITDKAKVAYNRKSIDSTSIQADQSFINDKFWLLFPYHLVWDEGITISDPIKEKAPISGTQQNKITVLYGNEGGYTPGDAYDVYYNDDYLIKEWVFRKGNSVEPSLTNTFENYKDYNGIKIAIDHKKQDGNWNLNFTNVRIK